MNMDKCKIESLLHETVVEFRVKPGCDEGDGMAGNLVSVVATTESGRTLEFIYKDFKEGKPGIQGFFETENVAYTKLIPTMSEFGFSRGLKPLGDEKSLIPAAKVIDPFIGANPKDTYICVEDIRGDGYRMANKYDGLSLPEVKMVLNSLAQFHAIGYALIRYEGEKIFHSEGPFNKLAKLTASPKDSETGISTATIASYMTPVTAALALTLEFLEIYKPELRLKVGEHFERTGGFKLDAKVQWPTMYKTDSHYFPVIAHGDLWTNNIMFKYDVKGHPVSVKFVDFQLTRRGNIFEDLGYFIYTSTTPTFRADHLLPVLRQYYDRFITTLGKLETPAPIGWTLGQFLDSFRDITPAAYRYMCFAIPLQLGTSLEAVDRIIKARNPIDANGVECVQSDPKSTQDQVNDFHKHLVASMKLQMETEPRAMERLLSLTQEMVDLNIL